MRRVYGVKVTRITRGDLPSRTGRNPGHGNLETHNNGASGVTVTRETYRAEAETRLMEEIVSRANMQKAYNRVVSNKGAAGVDNIDATRIIRVEGMEKCPQQTRPLVELRSLK
jgi:hypothetical protein